MSIELDSATITGRLGSAASPERAVLRFHKPNLPLRIFFRVRQFVRGLIAHVEPAEMLTVADILPKPALARFCQMPLDAQRHSLNVLYALQKRGHNHPDLAAAALLHDVGKVASQAAGVRLNPWLRTPLVLAAALAPERFRRWAVDDPRAGWRYVVHVHLAHPRIGAAWAAADGCSPLTCWLIEHHQDEQPNPPDARAARLLSLLQWADSRN